MEFTDMLAKLIASESGTLDRVEIISTTPNRTTIGEGLIAE